MPQAGIHGRPARAVVAAWLALVALPAAAQDPLWVARYTSDSFLGPDARGVALAAGPDATVYVLAQVSNGYDTDFLTLKYDAAGVLLWVRRYDSGVGDTPRALAVDAAGRVGVTGSSVLPVNGTRTLVCDADGTLVWSAFHAGAGSVALAWGPGGSVYVAGGKLNSGFQDVWLARYDAAGAEQWSSTWGAANSGDWLAALAVDAAGNAYAPGTGSSRATPSR